MDDLVERLEAVELYYKGGKAVKRPRNPDGRQAAAEIRNLRAQVERLQTVLDSRPAINVGLPESYIKWTQSVMLAEASQAAGVVQ